MAFIGRPSVPSPTARNLIRPGFLFDLFGPLAKFDFPKEMSPMKLRAACVVLGFLSLAQLTFAQSTAETASALPRLVRFGGTVKDLNGSPLTGVVGITFALYSEQTGGAALWLETQNVTADGNGHYVALLGSTKPDGLPTELFITEQARWVGVQVSGQAEQPRVLLVSVPYALRALDAETVGGRPASAFMPAPNSSASSSSNAAVNGAVAPSGAAPALSGGGTKDYVPLWLSSTKLGNSKLFQSATGNVGVGTKTPAATLDVNGAVNAATSYNVGGTAFAYGSYANSNAFLGFAGNSTMTGTSNTASGWLALYSNTTGYGNTASGFGTLGSNTAGSNNTAVGNNSLLQNTTGKLNTATGSSALESNSTGQYNTASGSQAMTYNETGSNNVASGAFALFDNYAGSDNTAIGFNSLFGNLRGSENTALGETALFVSTGNNNTGVGYNAGYNVTNGSNNIEIGNQGTASDSGAIRIGTAGTQTSAFIAGIYGTATSVNNAVPVLIDSNGNLGTISSSRRYKEDIQDMGDASNGLMRLRPVTFRYKKPFADGSQPMQYGLIAEEVAEVYPDMVARSADGQIETVKYQLLDPMLLNEVQRQQNEVQRQQAEIRDLQARLSTMEATLASVSHAPGSR
jgi:hypothetical protein